MKQYPFGRSNDITLAAGESIAIFTRAKASILQKVAYVNNPSTYELLASVEGAHTVLGPYASGAILVIEAGADEVLYEIGTDPVVKEHYNNRRVLSAPVAVDATGAVSADAILGGIVTSTTAAAVAGTVPAGAVLDAASEFPTNEGVEWTVINTGGANAFTVTAAAGHTIVGNAVVAASSSGTFVTRRTAVDTFITYRK
ncbi:MAG: hypothetical protein WC736_15620 [Gallionella sp.]|jgi:hypothetical protein